MVIIRLKRLYLQGKPQYLVCANLEKGQKSDKFRLNFADARILRQTTISCMSKTKTYQLFPLSRRAYFEIRQRLENAGLLERHTFHNTGERIFLPEYVFHIDTSFDDKKDCKRCNDTFICNIHNE